MMQFSKSLEGKLELQKMLRTVEGAWNLSVLSLFLKDNYGKRIAKNFFEGLKKSGYYLDAEKISFEENVHLYLNQFKKYIEMDWNQKPIKRSSFNYKPKNIS